MSPYNPNGDSISAAGIGNGFVMIISKSETSIFDPVNNYFLQPGKLHLYYTTRRVPVQRAGERDELPYPHKVHDTTLRPILNITIQSTIVVRSRSRSCGGGDICGKTPA